LFSVEREWQGNGRFPMAKMFETGMDTMPGLDFLGNYLFFHTLSYVAYMRDCARIIRRGAEKQANTMKYYMIPPCQRRQV